MNSFSASRGYGETKWQSLYCLVYEICYEIHNIYIYIYKIFQEEIHYCTNMVNKLIQLVRVTQTLIAITIGSQLSFLAGIHVCF